MNIDDAGSFIEKSVPKYAIISINGTILKATLDENALIKIFPTISQILNNLPIAHMYIKSPVVVFRVSDNILTILLTQISESMINRMLEGFMTEFGEFFKRQYAILPKNLKDLVKFSVFSVARQVGPEPLGWLENGCVVSEEAVFKYSLASMMVLMNEINGANKRILNFHPFISEGLMGMIYLFQIPLKDARGGAFDAAVLVMARYEDRTVLYQFHNPLERIFSITADEFVREFQTNFPDDIHRSLMKNERAPFEMTLRNLNSRLQTISIGFKQPVDVKNEMLDSIKKLSELI